MPKWEYTTLHFISGYTHGYEYSANGVTSDVTITGRDIHRAFTSAANSLGGYGWELQVFREEYDHTPTSTPSLVRVTAVFRRQKD